MQSKVREFKEAETITEAVWILLIVVINLDIYNVEKWKKQKEPFSFYVEEVIGIVVLLWWKIANYKR